METYLLRVWLPDRPGALGAVASRIGAVKGDVIGIEILETGDGRAVDELVVRVPEATPIDLLVEEVRQVDEVHVEDLAPTGEAGHDPRLAGLEAAAALAGAADLPALLAAFDAHGAAAVGATWTALVDPAAGRVLRATGPAVPAEAWLVAFAAASDPAAGTACGTGSSDVVVATAEPAELRVVAGRDRVPWRTREARHVATFARILGHRVAALSPRG